jgi:uncharacterized protein YndB with AHSA1/START domain
MDLATFTEQDGRPAVRLERVHAQSPERLWTALTDPDELAHWFPSRAVIELREGGKVEFTGDPRMSESTGTVVVCEPARRLGYTWGGNELLFTLEALDGGGCRLVLTDFLEAENTAARNAAGWCVCLEELGKHLDGQQSAGPHGSAAAESWQSLYDRHIAAGIPYGAEIPGQ